MEHLMFTKHLKRTGALSLPAAAEWMRESGFDGADLTVRPGGYVAPEDAISELPEAIEVLESAGLDVPMITTAITDADDPATEDILETAESLGIEYVKLGYWRYDGFGTISDALATMRRDLEGLIELGRSYAPTLALHTHSGDYLTAEPAVLWTLLSEFDPEELSAYIDPGHMAIEGGGSGWKMGLDLLTDRVEMISAKDFGWFRTDEGWQYRKIPLEEGIVRWSEVFDFLNEMRFDGPVSIHAEYDYPFDELAEQAKDDLAYVRSLSQ